MIVILLSIRNYLGSINCKKNTDNRKKMCDNKPTLKEC